MAPNKLPVARQLALSFSKQWEDFGNTSSPALVELWTIIFQTFNDCIERNVNESEGEYSVIPAVTGSGKTLCYRWYAAELAKQSLSNPDSPGMVIVTTLKKETDESVAMINEWACREVSIAYNGDSDIKVFNDEHLLDDHQIVIIQHEYFKRHHHLRSSSRSACKQMMSYKGKARELIVIDESIQLIEAIEISEYTLKKIVGWLAENKGELRSEFHLVDFLRDNFDTLFSLNEGAVEHIGKSTELLKKLSNVLNESESEVLRILQMKDALELLKLDPDLFSQDFDNPRKSSLVKYMSDLKHILHENLYKYKEGAKLEYRSSSLELPVKSVVVLDATSSVDKTYDNFPNAVVVQVPSVKTYEDVTVKVLTVSGGVGARAITADSYRSYDNIMSLIFDTEVRGDKFVTFTFKALAEQSTEPIDHFGNLTGVNSYKDCVEVYIYGIYFRPSFVYYDYLFQGNSHNPKVFSKGYLSILKELKYSHIAADIIQMINRGSCRGIVNNKAPKMNVTLLLPNDNNNLSKVILSAIQNEMTGVRIESESAKFRTITPASPRDGNITKNDQRIIEYLKQMESPKIKLSVLLKKLSLSVKQQKRVINHLTKEVNGNTFLAYESKQLGYSAIKDGQWYLVSKDIGV